MSENHRENFGGNEKSLAEVQAEKARVEAQIAELSAQAEKLTAQEISLQESQNEMLAAAQEEATVDNTEFDAAQEEAIRIEEEQAAAVAEAEKQNRLAELRASIVGEQGAENEVLDEEVGMQGAGEASTTLEHSEPKMRMEEADLLSSSLMHEENGPDAWQTIKDELEEGGAAYKDSIFYEDAMRDVFRRCMNKKDDFRSLKKAIEVFGTDVLTPEREKKIVDGVLDQRQLTRESLSLIEATGIDLSKYHDEGLSKIESIVNMTSDVDQSRGFLSAGDVYQWRNSFGISDNEYAESLKQMYFKNPHKYSNNTLSNLGFAKNGKWAWD